MTSEAIYDQLRDIIKVYLPEDVSVDSITPESHLIQELNINSAHLIDVVLDVEDAFNISIKDHELQALDTVSNAIKLIQEKINN
ncbi:phosphopantetheine-binding protein [Aureisphaera galaxeae]|uniref:acyl carrier protein n=1 Tax=Aureisphaera galaxeae TaxID=1538023 RepID=UPI00234FCC0E|nr:phosphopantetheine-binding protein [Aureisphaera galaxeae]MDC8004226.1 phosphopantetheine-binding protein [Aureisphaera galaxeae]